VRIERFTLRNGYGYLNMDVQFKPRLTFLTGINGSGKTTVVRGLIAALTPSFSMIANMAFEEMTIGIGLDSGAHTIRVTRSRENFEIFITSVDGSLIVPLFAQADYEPPGRFVERENEFYREFHTTILTHSIVRFLQELPTPMFLDLERRYRGPRVKRRFATYADRAPTHRPVFGGTLAEGLTDAIELAEDSYRQLISRRHVLMNTLRKELILTAFTSTRSESIFGKEGIQLPDKFESGQLSRQRELVLEMMQSLGIDDPQVIVFFDEVQVTLTRIAGRPLDALLKDESGRNLVGEWLGVQPKLEQIDRIVHIVEKHNARLKRAEKRTSDFLALINGFLADGEKRLEFEAGGKLRVLYRDTPLRGIAGLSSGERQLVVILTHLVFNEVAHKANVLIIDEPELSLHVKWQEMFVDALEATSQETQFILATHSPSIILQRVADCVDIGRAG
jgi:predicted ATP-binding protein involved in virulence